MARDAHECPTCLKVHRRTAAFCSKACHPFCSVEGCDSRTWSTRKECRIHMDRAKPLYPKRCRTCNVEIDGRLTFCSEECRPCCAFETCERKVQGRLEYCSPHWVQMRDTGQVKELTWAQEWKCIVCGAEVEKGSRRRRHCSHRCQAMSSRNPDRPAFYNCARCGVEVSLIDVSTKAGQRKRCDSKLCKRCKWKTRTGMSVGEVAKRDGTQCKICGDEVDLNADSKDPFRGSVDHILPRSLGGTHDPENLQLSHLWCNQVKRNRADFSLMREAVNNVGN